MKILYIHQYFTDSNKNGANVVAFTCFEMFSKRDNSVFFFATDEKPYLMTQNINRYFPKSYINKKGIINKIKYRLNAIYNFEAENNIKKVIEEIKPDIIHIHSLLELSCSVLKPICKAGIPTVMTIHDAGFVCPVMGTNKQKCSKCAGNVFHCIKNKCSKQSYLCSLYVAVKFAINRHFVKKYPPKAYITPSKALNILVSNSIAGHKSYILPNCLDTVFDKLETNSNDDGYFLYVGGLLDIKGVNNLLCAFKGLPSEINLHIVGTGLHEDKYKKYVSNNNLQNVKFIGKLDRVELCKEYNNCRAVIVPSNCFEIFGMVNIEAFSCSKPVIGSNAGGIPEIIDDNYNGFIFEPDDINQLQKCILKYYNNPDLAHEHGKNAYMKAKSLYSRAFFQKQLNSIYENTVKI